MILDTCKNYNYVGTCIHGFEVPCDHSVLLCPNTTVTFICSLTHDPSEPRLSWHVPKLQSSNSMDEVLRIPFSYNDPNTTSVDIYTVTVTESTLTSTSSELSFTVPNSLLSDSTSKELYCTNSLNSNEGKMSCFFEIQSIQYFTYNNVIIIIECYTYFRYTYSSLKTYGCV